MTDFIIKKIENTLSDKDFTDLGFSKNYIEPMKSKSEFLKLKIFDLTVIQANILKQTALSKGCDCATHAGCLNNAVEKTDVILFGTKSQLALVLENLKLQQFKMPKLADEIEKILTQKPTQKTPLIMGILNLTEDSFSDGGKYLDPKKAIVHAKKMIQEGADIIDIGAESTRPGADEILSKTQIERITPVLKELYKQFPNTVFSIDTRSSEVIKEMVKICPNLIINDVSGCQFDPKMAKIASETQNKIIICHSSSIPKDMQEKTDYKNIVDDIYKFFAQKIDELTAVGIKKENIIIDLGFGFGKTIEQNFELIKRSSEFLTLNCPILAGISRKSFIQKTVPNGDFDNLTAALCAELFLKGTTIFRVHNVKQTKDALDLFKNLS